jgi:hypothetical protein
MSEFALDVSRFVIYDEEGKVYFGENKGPIRSGDLPRFFTSRGAANNSISWIRNHYIYLRQNPPTLVIRECRVRVEEI